MGNQKLAVIDMGSNSIRLVIFAVSPWGRSKIIHNFKEVARLRDHFDKNNRINEEGIDKIINTLQHFQTITRHYNIINTRGIATAAVRQATNQQEILNRIQNETDYTFNVLSEKEEAYYGYVAVTNSMSIQDGITIDIGGGSTEVTYFKNRELTHYHSFPFGSLTLKSFIKHDKPTPYEMKELTDFLREQYEQLPWLQGHEVPLIGIGGSARNMCLIHQSDIEYPLPDVHQYEMPISEIERINHMLQEMSLNKREKVDGLSKDRADIIIPSIHAIQTLADVINAPSFIMSQKGLREGIFYSELLHQRHLKRFPSIKEKSFFEMRKDYDIPTDQVTQVEKIALTLYRQLKAKLYLPDQGCGEVDLKNAAQVIYAGDYIDQESKHQHTFYLLANRSIDGFSHKERLRMALIASYKSRPFFNQFIKPFKKWFAKAERRNIELLGSLLRLSYSLNISRRDVVDDIQLSATESGLVMTVYCNQYAGFEEKQTQKYKKHVEKNLKTPIECHFVQKTLLHT